MQQSLRNALISSSVRKKYVSSENIKLKEINVKYFSGIFIVKCNSIIISLIIGFSLFLYEVFIVLQRV